MFGYVLRRFLGSIPTLAVLIAASFFLMRFAPGGPFDGNRKIPPEIIAQVKRHYHLDESLPAQFLRYLQGLIQGDFGPSFKFRDLSVWDLLAQGFPISLELGVWAMLVAVLAGGAMGMAAAFHRQGPIDVGTQTIGLMGIAVPNFVLAPILQLIFGVQLAWLPVASWDGSAATKILPVLVLAIPQIAYIARLTRGAMIEVLSAPHIRTARAKGLPGWIVVLRHSLPGALAPVLAYLGPATAAVVTGSVIVEKVFAIPGIGRHFVDAALNRDYPLVLGVTIIYGVAVIGANILVDIAVAAIDPKIRQR